VSGYRPSINTVPYPLTRTKGSGIKSLVFLSGITYLRNADPSQCLAFFYR
jgi:hypothetical protein